MLTPSQATGTTHPPPREPDPHNLQRERPVVLATIAVALDPCAVAFALACAVESGHPTLVAGFLAVTPCRSGRLPAPELDAILQPAIDRLRLAVPRLQVIKVQSPRPLRAIIEIATDLDAGLLAFGPDPARLPVRRYRRATRFLANHAPCLLWLADNGAICA